jgi:hypothetical protein
MLRKERKREYFVYPSWAEGQLSYSWEDLPKMMADPFRYDEHLRLNYTKEKMLKYGYPEVTQPYDFFKGPLGGGIIIAHINNDEKWLPACILIKEATLSAPHPMETAGNSEGHNVRYLDLNGAWNWETGEYRKMKNYIIGISAEHIESEPASQYWLLSMKPGKKEPSAISDIPVWAYHFGIEMERLSEVPQTVLLEISTWLKPDFSYIWFKIRQKSDEYGWHFAVMLYIGLHLAYIGKNRIRTLHMLASIEGKPGPYTQRIRKIF